MDMENLIEYLLIHHRWIIASILLPISTLFRVFLYVRNWVAFNFQGARRKHEDKVADVQRQVLEWHKSGRNKPICTGRPGWMTMSLHNPKYKNRLYKVNINLRDIVRVDIERKVVILEPLVTVGQISSLLLPLGWTLPIMPELEDLTIGGLIMGTGVETSSHKYGLFQHICNRFEVVLSDGSVVHCSKNENEDLFYSLPWSHGTLGLLVSAEIQIVPAKKFVKVHYQPVSSMKELMNMVAFETRRKDRSDFVEGIMFSPNKAVIMTADMTDEVERYRVNKIGRWYKPWFFKHVETYTRKEGTQYIPLVDYYHRHSRSLFWEIQLIIPFGNHFVFRWLFGWMLPVSVGLMKLTESKTINAMYEKHHTVQDMLVPLKRLQDTLEFFDENLKVYPLWICPFNLPSNPGFVHPEGNSSEMYVDIGAYGEPQVKFNAVESTRKVEEYVRNNKGFQMLYATTYMTKEEFRKMFDHTIYDKVRNEQKCMDAFPDVYDKVSYKARTSNE